MDGPAWTVVVVARTGDAPDLMNLGRLQLSLRVRNGVHLRVQEGPDAPNAGRYFHLAQAYQASNNTAGVTEALAKAKEHDLKESSLHALEREAYKQLMSQAGPK